MGERKETILILEPAGVGGICQYTYKLTSYLVTNGCEVNLITNKNYEFDKGKNFKVIKKFMKVNFNKSSLKLFQKIINGFLYILSLLFIVFYVLNNKVSIVHMQWISSPIIDRYFVKLLKSLKVKIVVTAHNIIPHEPKDKDKVNFSRLYNEVDQIIVHSNKNIEQAKKILKINDYKKFNVIPHGNFAFSVPHNTSHSQLRESFGINEKDKTLLFFGLIREYKGLDILLESLNILNRKFHDWKLIIAGNSDNFLSYEKQIKEYEIENKVIKNISYIPIEEVGNYFIASDVVVLPYRNIYQSGVVQMSYSYGKPIIGTKVGGLVDVIEDGKSGYLVEPNSPHALAEILYDTFKNRDLKEMGNYAQYLSNTKYSWDSISKLTIKLYKNTVKR